MEPSAWGIVILLGVCAWFLSKILAEISSIRKMVAHDFKKSNPEIFSDDWPD